MTPDGASTAGSDGPADGEGDAVAPSDAFGALGGETRLDVVRALDADAPRAFSELFDATDEDTSAGFAYHLRQLTDRFVRRRRDERYELTDAGRSVARALRAGTYTASVDRGPVELDEECPVCADPELVATVEDNVTAVACESCGSPLLRLPLPPGGYADRATADLPDAVDAHHRRRIQSFGDGVCPECAGAASARIELAVDDPAAGRDDPDDPDDPDDAYVPVQAAFECETCGADLRCPVALTLLDHPAVVSFYHDHDLDVRDRPIWNVGSEWRERVVSRDPWCVVVSLRLDGDDLFLYVAGDGRVVDHRDSRDDSDESVASDSTGSGESVDESETPRADRDDPARGEDAGDDGVPA